MEYSISVYHFFSQEPGLLVFTLGRRSSLAPSSLSIDDIINQQQIENHIPTRRSEVGNPQMDACPFRLSSQSVDPWSPLDQRTRHILTIFDPHFLRTAAVELAFVMRVCLERHAEKLIQSVDGFCRPFVDE